MTDRRLLLSFSVLLLALAVTAVHPGHAQQAPFTQGGFDLAPVWIGASDVGDIDDDGDGDLVVAGLENAILGNQITKLYENVDDGGFAEVDADLAGVDPGTTDFFDADGDGDLDLLVTGEQGFSPSATLYENDGDGNFSEVGDAGLAGRQQSAAAIGDIDGDGAADLILAGLDGSLDRSTTLYENDGDGTFSATGDAGLPDVYGGGLDVADVDDDGDLDLILTGEDENNNSIATLYENQGDGSFAEAGESLEGTSYGSARFADANGDGAPDLLISGFTSPGVEAATLYENDGQGSFSEKDAGIEGVVGQAGFADVDLDGDLDLSITGDPDSRDPGVTLYENDGQGNFSALESNVAGVSGASLSIGDVDGDNDPDLLLSGEDPVFDASTRLYVNRTNQEPPNRAPQLGRSPSPGATAAGLSTSTAVEVGDPDGDAVSLSLTQDGSDAGASFSDEGGGLGTFAFSPNRSEAGTEVPFTVEASDGAGETASFSFSVSVPDVFAAADAGLTPLSSSSSDFGDINGNGTQELVVTGLDSSDTRQALLYEYDGQGEYAPMEAGLDGVSSGSSDFADIDSDGDLDLLVTGSEGGYVSPQTATLYENDGDGNFSTLNTDIDGVRSGTDAAFGDVDIDGDLDLVVIGNDDNLDPTAALYLNDGTRSFSKAGESLEGVEDGTAAFEDVDDDGDLDLLLTGDGSSGAAATIYENDGTGSFSDMGAGLQGATRSSATFGDVEGDGDSDLVIAGRVSYNPSTILHTNDGDGTFTERSIDAAPLEGAAVEFGDVDDDGDLDLLAAGGNEDGERVMTVYENDGAGNFSDLGAGLSAGAARGDVSIGDANGDGNYDLTVTLGVTDRGTNLYEGLRANAVSASASTSVGADGSVDFGDTGADIDFTGTSGSGSVLVKKLDTRPSGTRGIPEDNVSTYRFVIGAGGGLTFDEAAVRLDTGTLGGVSDASNVTVYSRPVQAEGSFTELPTSVESGDVVATANSFSEFVLASDS